MIFSGGAMRRDSCDEQEVPTNSITNTKLAECMQGMGKQPEAGTFKRLCRQWWQEVIRAPNSLMAVGMERDKQEALQKRIDGIWRLNGRRKQNEESIKTRFPAWQNQGRLLDLGRKIKFKVLIQRPSEEYKESYNKLCGMKHSAKNKKILYKRQ